MNIFVLDSDLTLCAQYHCDRHVIKMILEHAQLLSTATRMTHGVDHTHVTGKEWDLHINLLPGESYTFHPITHETILEEVRKLHVNNRNWLRMEQFLLKYQPTNYMNDEEYQEMLKSMHAEKWEIRDLQWYTNYFDWYGGYIDYDVMLAYKITHKNHPCAIWARESLDNWLWLQELNRQLNAEKIHRYGSSHKSVEMSNNLLVPDLPKIGLTPFATAMPPEYIVPGDAVESYRCYYCNSKVDIVSWKNRQPPEWYYDATVVKEFLNQGIE